MAEKQKEIRLAIYNSDLKFQGFKADTFWSMSKSYGKLHSYNDEPRLIANLIGDSRIIERDYKYVVSLDSVSNEIVNIFELTTDSTEGFIQIHDEELKARLIIEGL